MVKHKRNQTPSTVADEIPSMVDKAIVETNSTPVEPSPVEPTPTPSVEVTVLESVPDPQPLAPDPLAPVSKDAFSLPSNPSEVRIATLKQSLAEFIEVFDKPRVFTPAISADLATRLERMINVVAAGTSYSETQTQLNALRTAFHNGKDSSFRSSRIIGNLRDPRTGKLAVGNERSLNLIMLLLTTADPKAYSAHKGRVDVRNSVIGFPLPVAEAIIRYYS